MFDQATSDQPDEQDSFTLNTAVQAVAEGNYGHLDQQRRYTDALAAILFAPDEMPGAMAEIAPSDPHPPYYGGLPHRPMLDAVARSDILDTHGREHGR